MKINLSIKGFPFFKLVLGTVVLFGSLFFNTKLQLMFLIYIIIFGRAHSIGAWLGMWRAGKLNWKYMTWVFFEAVAVSYFGFMVVDKYSLAIFANILFMFHFFYDEAELQGHARDMTTALYSGAPFILNFVYLTDYVVGLKISFLSYVLLFLGMLFFEILFLKEVNWFFLHLKIISVFILSAIYVGISPYAMLYIFLLYHYIFWFIYPVHKLHKYDKKAATEFAMILIIIMILSVFVYTSFVWGLVEGSRGLTQEIERGFFIASIVHILATAPFAYLFGLPKSGVKV